MNDPPPTLTCLQATRMCRFAQVEANQLHDTITTRWNCTGLGDLNCLKEFSAQVRRCSFGRSEKARSSPRGTTSVDFFLGKWAPRTLQIPQGSRTIYEDAPISRGFRIALLCPAYTVSNRCFSLFRILLNGLLLEGLISDSSCEHEGGFHLPFWVFRR